MKLKTSGEVGRENAYLYPRRPGLVRNCARGAGTHNHRRQLIWTEVIIFRFQQQPLRRTGPGLRRDDEGEGFCPQNRPISAKTASLTNP